MEQKRIVEAIEKLDINAITEKTLNLITKKPTFMEEVKEEVAPGIEDGYENYSYDIKRLIKKMEAEVLDEEYGF